MDIYQRFLNQAGFVLVAGADEAGRGACAGPLVAGAVILGDDVPKGLDDSKRLRPAQREVLFEAIKASARAWAVGSVDAGECDCLGIQQADLKAMRQAVEALGVTPDFAITDGFAVPGLACPSIGMWKADQLVACVSAASIIAKVTRDHLMEQLALTYPGYGFEVHKGYATPDHQAALDAMGASPQHRRSYRNVPNGKVVAL